MNACIIDAFSFINPILAEIIALAYLLLVISLQAAADHGVWAIGGSSLGLNEAEVPAILVVLRLWHKK